MANRPLQRGVGALFQNTAHTAPAGVTELEGAQEIAVGLIDPNPYQPRTTPLDPVAQGEFDASIRAHGILQPVLVRRVGDRYQLIDGEQRWRAAGRVGLTVVPALERAASDDDMSILALVANNQRTALEPLDEATAYRTIMERRTLSLRELADLVGRSHTHIAQRIRLLDNPDITAAVAEGWLTPTVALSVDRVADPARRAALLDRARPDGPPSVAEARAARGTEGHAGHAGRAEQGEGGRTGTMTGMSGAESPPVNYFTDGIAMDEAGAEPSTVNYFTASPAIERAEAGTTRDSAHPNGPDEAGTWSGADQGAVQYFPADSPSTPTRAPAPAALRTIAVVEDDDLAPAAGAGVVRLRLLGASEDEVTALILELSQALGDRLQVERAQQGRKGDYLCYARVAPAAPLS